MSDSSTAALGIDTPAAQTIQFNEIPATLRDPRVITEIRPVYNDVGLLLLPSKALITGNMLAPAAGAAAAPTQVYPITGPGQPEALFGAGSVLATMLNAWMLNNGATPLFAAGVLDAAGAVKASTTIAIGAASFPGGFSCIVALATPFQVPIVVPAGSAPADLANAIIAGVNAMSAAPVTAALAAASTVNVVLTAKNAGLTGNDINVQILGRSDASAPVVSITVGGAVSANLAGGLGNPSIEPVIEVASGTWYTDWVQPWTDEVNQGLVAAEGMRRYGALVNLDCRFWQALNGSYASCAAFGDAGNSIQMITEMIRGSVDPAWMWAAAFGAVHAFRLANDPSRQSKGVAVLGITAPADGNIWLAEERDLLLNNGGSVWTALSDGTVVIARTITGYLESTLGVPDAAWLDVMTPATASAVRYDWDNYVKLVYPNAKLFDDGSIGAEYDDTAATPKRLNGSWMKRGRDYAEAGWVDSVASPGYVRNASDKNRLDGAPSMTIAGNLMILASALEFTA